jgi:hypothetical protein
VFTAAVVLGGVLAWPERPSPRPAASRDLPQPVAPTPAAPEPAPPQGTELAKVAQAQADSAEPTLRKIGGSRAPRDMDAALRRETAQVGRIRSLLAADPARAYRLAQAGHREFVRGMLREEREALAILSLWKLGRTALAERRTRAFVASYPQSALREQLEQQLLPEHGRDAPAR